MNHHPAADLDPAAEDAVARWLRHADARLRNDPPAGLLPAAFALAPAIRRRRRLAQVTIPAAAAVAALVITATALLTAGQAVPARPTALASASPAATAPAIPAEVPTGPGRPPLRIHLVDHPELVTLTPSEKTTALDRCSSGIPGDRSYTGPAEATLAVHDYTGYTVLLSRTATNGNILTAACGSRPSSRPLVNLSPVNTGEFQPAVPIALLVGNATAATDREKTTSELYATGKVTDRTALLLAVTPTGEAIVVPVGPTSHLFVAHLPVHSPADNQMTFYLYDPDGALLATQTSPPLPTQ
jgi:hypothetical protein